MAKAKYYLLTSDFITGAEAERIGLVSKARARRRGAARRRWRSPNDSPAGHATRSRLTKRALNHWLRQALPNFEASLAYEMLSFLGAEAAGGHRRAAGEAQARVPAMTIDRDLAADLALGLELAEIADAITLPYYEQRSFQPRLEGQPAPRSPRPTASAESAIAASGSSPSVPATACSARSTASVGNADSPWRWVIDPIDGTSNFVRGIPVWATLIALTHRGPRPRRRRRLGAGAGPALVGGARASARSPTAPAVPRVDRRATRRGTGVRDVLAAAGTMPGSPTSWSRCSRARTGPAASATSGSTCSSPRARSTWPSTPSAWRPYDLAAVMVVVEEAGGTFTDRHGERTYLNDSAISSNGLLHHHITALGEDAFRCRRGEPWGRR